MRSTAIDRRPDGSVSSFYHGRQYGANPAEGGRGVYANGRKGVSDRRARRLGPQRHQTSAARAEGLTFPTAEA